VSQILPEPLGECMGVPYAEGSKLSRLRFGGGFVPAAGTWEALIGMTVGKGGGPDAETFVHWCKEKVLPDGSSYIDVESSWGRDVAAILKRIGPLGLLSFTVPSDERGYYALKIRASSYRSMAHCVKPSGQRVDVPDVSPKADRTKMLYGVPSVGSHTEDQPKSYRVIIPTQGSAAALAAPYKGQGGDADAFSVISVHKWHEKGTAMFESSRGSDVAAVMRRLGDGGFTWCRVQQFPGPVCLKIAANSFRSVAHLFKRCKSTSNSRAVEEVDVTDDSDDVDD
jgi:hypothetical protein